MLLCRLRETIFLCSFLCLNLLERSRFGAVPETWVLKLNGSALEFPPFVRFEKELPAPSSASCLSEVSVNFPSTFEADFLAHIVTLSNFTHKNSGDFGNQVLSLSFSLFLIFFPSALESEAAFHGRVFKVGH